MLHGMYQPFFSHSHYSVLGKLVTSFDFNILVYDLQFFLNAYSLFFRGKKLHLITTMSEYLEPQQKDVFAVLQNVVVTLVVTH